jgi:hypothetical protein
MAAAVDFATAQQRRGDDAGGDRAIGAKGQTGLYEQYVPVLITAFR